MPSPWLAIPLADYEAHMALPEIGQADLLAAEFGAALAELAPASLAVVGCAGGNGFERISPQATRRVVAIDINPAYLATLTSRFADRLPGLETHALDIGADRMGIAAVDFVYAALLFEYVEPGQALRHLGALCRRGGTLLTVLQLPSASMAAISPSPYAALRALAPAMRLLAADELQAHAAAAGFELQSSRIAVSPAGKQFAIRRFRRILAAES